MLRRLKEYFEELINEENKMERKVKMGKVVKVSKRIKNGKAVCPDGIPVGEWKNESVEEKGQFF